MAIYLLSQPLDRQKAQTRFDFLLKKECDIELTEKKKNRTWLQNRYLHAILGYFSLSYGETLEYVKEHFFKLTVNPDIFVYERVNQKTGEIRIALRSTADLDSRELSLAIEKFRDWSSKDAGIYLPLPNEHQYLNQIEREISLYSNQLYI